MAEGLEVEPLVAYPKLAEVGKKYLLTIDLQWDHAGKAWPFFPEEEYAVYCMVNPHPLFVVEPVGIPAVVLHRFGGTYGPARFVLTALGPPAQGGIRVSLVNAHGTTMRVLRLDGICTTREEIPWLPVEVNVDEPRRNEADLIQFLSDLEPIKREQKLKHSGLAYRKDEALTGEPIRVDGRVYDKGLTLMGDSRLEYDLDGAYEDFRAVLRIEEYPETDRLVRVTIACDGVEVFAQEVKLLDVRQLEVSVRGAHRLTIAVGSNRLPANYATATFADARLSRADAPQRRARRCPYRDLAPYREEDSDLFFGREDDLASLIGLIERNRITVMAGARRMGKTSLLQAGLVPHVRRHGLAALNGWRIISVTPGDSLSHALRAHWANPTPRGVKTNRHEETERLLRDLIGDQPLLLLIDRFEELFTSGQLDFERLTLAQIFSTLARQPSGNVRTVLAGWAGLLRPLEAHLHMSDLKVTPWTLPPLPLQSKVRDIIREPARLCGYSFEHEQEGYHDPGRGDLAERIAEEVLLRQLIEPPTAPGAAASAPNVGDESSSAPGPDLYSCLQAALVQLWALAESRGTREFTHADYDLIGGLDGSIGNYAERAYEALARHPDLGAEGQRLSQTIFTALLRAADSRPPRLVAPLDAILSATRLHPLTYPVVDYWRTTGILSLEGRPAPRPGALNQMVITLEFADRILGRWKRLTSWDDPGPTPAAPQIRQAGIRLGVTEISYKAGRTLRCLLDGPGVGNRESWEVSLETSAIQMITSRVQALWSENRGASTEFTDRIARYGTELVHAVLPPNVQAILQDHWSEIASFHVVNVQGASLIPWEVMFLPSASLPGGGQFLGDLGLVRSFLLQDQHPAPQSVQLRYREGRARVLVGNYPPGISDEAEEREEADCVRLFGAGSLVPSTISLGQILRELRTLDLLYVGVRAEPDSENRMPRFVLERRGNRLEPILEPVTPQTVMANTGYGVDNVNYPLVIFNAAGAAVDRSGPTYLDAFADVFFRASAGAFVGPLWSLPTRRNLTFIRNFFSALRDGFTLAQAAGQARQATRRAGDPNWAAFAVYGDPDARLMVEPGRPVEETQPPTPTPREKLRPRSTDKKAEKRAPVKKKSVKKKPRMK